MWIPTWDRVSPHFLQLDRRTHRAWPRLVGTGHAGYATSCNREPGIRQALLSQDDPIGKHFGIDFPQYSGAFEIVGVFHDFKMNNPRDLPRPVFLRPLAQYYNGYKTWTGGGAPPSFIDAIVGGETQSMFIDAIIVNFRMPQQNADELLRRTLASIDPNLTVVEIRTFDAQVAGNFTQDRLVARLTTLFGILSLVLASVGLYGVMSYFVARRTSEIGIRMALGATRSSVLGMVMRSALWQVLVGLVIGIPAALGAGYLMKSLLYGVASYDPLALAGAPLLLALCAVAAGFIPARRAASIEPMRALRIE